MQVYTVHFIIDSIKPYGDWKRNNLGVTTSVLPASQCARSCKRILLLQDASFLHANVNDSAFLLDTESERSSR